MTAVTQARDRALERLERLLAQANGEVVEAEGRRAEADAAAREAAADTAAAKQRAVQVGARAGLAGKAI